jgi:CheY-like chemotaxis protein
VAHSIAQNAGCGSRLARRSRRAAARPRILIAEDDARMRELVDWILREAGYDTARVVDGQEAIEVAEQFGPFDLLLTDLVMPRMLGTELARRLRQTDPALKVLYFTGYSDRLFKEKGALWDDEAFLEKPSSVDGLVEAVSLLLDGHLPPATARKDALSWR